MYRDSLFYLNFTSKPRNVQISLVSRPLLTITDLNKFGKANFGHSKFLPVFLYKKVSINLECAFLANLNLYQSSCERLLGKIWNGHIWPFQIYTSLFGKNYLKKFEMAIFGHSGIVLIIFLYISL